MLHINQCRVSLNNNQCGSDFQTNDRDMLWLVETNTSVIHCCSRKLNNALHRFEFYFVFRYESDLRSNSSLEKHESKYSLFLLKYILLSLSIVQVCFQFSNSENHWRTNTAALILFEDIAVRSAFLFSNVSSLRYPLRSYHRGSLLFPSHLVGVTRLTGVIVKTMELNCGQFYEILGFFNLCICKDLS